MPVSNGYRFSNYDGSANIPYLCDPDTGEWEQMSRPYVGNGTETCDCCDFVGDDVRLTYFPAVLQERRGHYNYGYDESQQCIVRAPRAGTIYQSHLCEECNELCQLIMKTSDHVALGTDWWDLNDSLTETIKELKEKRIDWRQTKPIKDAVKAGTQIFVAKTGPFNQLPDDVIISMYPHLIRAYKDRAAVQIQRIWKGYYNRLYRNTQNIMHHNCADCGRLRSYSELCTEQSCLDCLHECCHKLVCKDECHYLCPYCEGSSFIGWAWKNHQGERMDEECRWCGETFELPIFWHGPSQSEADAAAHS